MPCPANAHTEFEATVASRQCICNSGFVRKYANRSFTCQCPAGYKFEDSGLLPPYERQCVRCERGSFKTAVDNGICTQCPFLHASTIYDGAIRADECVCGINYYMPPNRALPTSAWDGKINRTNECVACNVGADCYAEGTTIKTMKVHPGHWRVNAFSDVVLECPQQLADEICAPANATVAPASLNASSAALPACRGGHDARTPYCAACVVGYTMEDNGLCVICSGSVVGTVLPPAILVGTFIVLLIVLGCSGARGREKLKSMASFSSDIFDTARGVNDVDGGEELKLSALTDALKDQATGAIKGAVLDTLNEKLEEAEEVLDKKLDEAGEVADSLERVPTQGAANEAEKGSRHKQVGRATAAAAQRRKDRERLTRRPARGQRQGGPSRIKGCVGKIKEFFSRSFVKIRILISLAQVLDGIGKVCDIPYPQLYQDVLNWFEGLQLDLFTLMPLDCLLSPLPTNFYVSLVFRTVWPLAACTALYLISQAMERTIDFQWASATCQSIMFFIMFLVYPGCSAKVFAVFQCYSFDGKIDPDNFPRPGGMGYEEGLDNMLQTSRWLKADLSIDCNSNIHRGMEFYGFVMLAVYPIGQYADRALHGLTFCATDSVHTHLVRRHPSLFCVHTVLEIPPRAARVSKTRASRPCAPEDQGDLHG